MLCTYWRYPWMKLTTHNNPNPWNTPAGQHYVARRRRNPVSMPKGIPWKLKPMLSMHCFHQVYARNQRHVHYPRSSLRRFMRLLSWAQYLLAFMSIKETFAALIWSGHSTFLTRLWCQHPIFKSWSMHNMFWPACCCYWTLKLCLDILTNIFWIMLQSIMNW